MKIAWTRMTMQSANNNSSAILFDLDSLTMYIKQKHFREDN